MRALVRDVPKARKLFADLAGGGILELAAADITQAATLQPEFFKGVRQIVHCAAVTVGASLKGIICILTLGPLSLSNALEPSASRRLYIP